MNRFLKLKFVLFSSILFFIIASCNKSDNENQNKDAVKTVVINSGSNDVASVTSNTVVFNGVRNDLKTGNIIVSGSTINSPRGFLRKITDINYSGNQTTVTTEDATIEEAAKGYLRDGQSVGDSVSYQFLASDTGKILGGKVATTDALVININKIIETPSGLNVTINGSLKVKPDFEKIAINMVMENGIPRFTSMYFLPQTENELNVTISSKLTSTFDKEWELQKFTGPTIVMNLGGMPVLVTPEVIFYVGAVGDLTADLEYQYFNKSILRAGFAYTDQWITPQTNGLTVLDENSTASVNVTGNCKVYIKPEFNLYFYDKDFVSCGVSAKPYARFNAALNVDKVDWSIYGGINADAYFKAQVFGYTFADQTWEDLFTLPEWNINSGSYPFSNWNPPTVSTNAITDITQSSATSGGNVSYDGGSPVSARGVCWSTSQNPSIADSKTNDGSGIGIFISGLSSLASNTTYYMRAYATNSVGTAYGNQLMFTTGQTTAQATVTTNPITDVTQTSAISGGNVLNDGGNTVVARGVCWSTFFNPTIADSKTSNGSGTGSFSSIITGLTANTPYYVRAYATNNAGTAYGSQLTFTAGQTTTQPTVITNAVTDITQTSAITGGNVTSDGGVSVSVRGVCWSTSNNPTISDSKTTDGSGTGTFSSSITGLAASTTYHVRAYATNSSGTAYGNEVSFVPTTPFTCGSSLTINHVAGVVAPIDKTVTYGTVTNIPGATDKCWIAQNLGADHQATSVDDATEAAAGWYWQFNKKQGFKHNGTTRTPATTWISYIDENSDWIAANDPCTLELGSGWRLPTSTEWSNVDATGGWTTWTGPYASGLKLHAAGNLSISGGSLLKRGSVGAYWSSSQNIAIYGGYLVFTSGNSYMMNKDKAYGFTARCLRD